MEGGREGGRKISGEREEWTIGRKGGRKKRERASEKEQERKRTRARETRRRKEDSGKKPKFITEPVLELPPSKGAGKERSERREEEYNRVQTRDDKPIVSPASSALKTKLLPAYTPTSTNARNRLFAPGARSLASDFAM